MIIEIFTVVVKNLNIALSKSIWTSTKFYDGDASKCNHL